MKILFFSNNPHKIVEVKKLLSSMKIDILTLDEIGRQIVVEETGANYLENALLKAKNVLLTPHIAASTVEAQIIVAEMVANQFVDYFIDNKINNSVI